AARGEVALPMRADVAEREEPPVRAGDGDELTAHLERLRISVADLVGRANGDELRHGYRSSRSRAAALRSPAPLPKLKALGGRPSAPPAFGGLRSRAEPGTRRRGAR